MNQNQTRDAFGSARALPSRDLREHSVPRELFFFTNLHLHCPTLPDTVRSSNPSPLPRFSFLTGTKNERLFWFNSWIYHATVFFLVHWPLSYTQLLTHHSSRRFPREMICCFTCGRLPPIKRLIPLHLLCDLYSHAFASTLDVISSNLVSLISQRPMLTSWA